MSPPKNIKKVPAKKSTRSMRTTTINRTRISSSQAIRAQANRQNAQAERVAQTNRRNNALTNANVALLNVVVNSGLMGGMLAIMTALFIAMRPTLVDDNDAIHQWNQEALGELFNRGGETLDSHNARFIAIEQAQNTAIVREAAAAAERELHHANLRNAAAQLEINRVRRGKIHAAVVTNGQAALDRTQVSLAQRSDNLKVRNRAVTDDSAAGLTTDHAVNPSLSRASNPAADDSSDTASIDVSGASNPAAGEFSDTTSTNVSDSSSDRAATANSNATTVITPVTNGGSNGAITPDNDETPKNVGPSSPMVVKFGNCND